jgi:hypothetical protein
METELAGSGGSCRLGGLRVISPEISKRSGGCTSTFAGVGA